uniref:C2h2-type zn-finger protein n=1 Tax=Culex tarsalis TaxID=7177 RepID=A0A1Q3F320_CULTA
MAQMCRLCLRPSSGKHALFKTTVGDASLEEVLRDTFHLELPKDRSLPKYICECCLRKVECLQQFHKEVIRCQKLLLEGKGVREDTLTTSSDGLYEQIEMLEDEQLLLEEEPLHPVESVQVESFDFEAEQEEEAEEQLIDIKIEALVEENDDEGADQAVEEVEGEGLQEDEDASLGNEEPIPVKLARASRKPREKLEVVETIPNKCYVCNEVLESKDAFDVHLVNHSNMLPHQCLQCSTESNPIHLKTVLALNKHYESHGFNFVCKNCPLRFRSYPPLYDHARNAHVEINTEFSCETCGQKFIEIRKYRKHVLAHKNRELQKYKCETCEKTFQTGTLLRRHQRTHSNEVHYVCPFCGRGFNHESNFAQHKMRHIRQQQLELNGHPCKECGTHFTTAFALRKHMVEHYPNDPVYVAAARKVDYFPAHLKDPAAYPRRCEEPNCAYIAATYALMWSHYRNHYKSYPCKECDRKFATATILKNHVDVVHRKIRKYQCEYCQKTFAYQHKYKEHIHVHMGFKGRECRYCNKSFTHSSNLLVHERIHSGTKPYRCDLCGSRYITSSALKKHQRTHGVVAVRQQKPEEEQNSKEQEEEEQPVYLMEDEEEEEEDDDDGGQQDVVDDGEMEVERKELIATLEGV